MDDPIDDATDDSIDPDTTAAVGEIVPRPPTEANAG